ncbi:hypothetical protein E2P81_ATG06400 [Venturia nashicola]|nr:hypothetical protein E2P81_ATG06400 [Venturia nashicola]
MFLLLGWNGDHGVTAQTLQDPETSSLPFCGAQCIQQQSQLAKSPNGPCMPNHANCYCSRADFANQVKICVTSNAALKCSAAADIKLTNAWVDGYCGDSRTGTGGNGDGTGSGTGQVSVMLQSGTFSLTSTSTTSKIAAPTSTPEFSTFSPSVRLSNGTKVGIAIGVLAIIAVVATLTFFLFRNRQRNKALSPVYEVEDEKRVHEVDGMIEPSEMDSKNSALVSVPIYELPSPGGGGKSELEDTQTRSTPTHQGMELGSGWEGKS